MKNEPDTQKMVPTTKTNRLLLLIITTVIITTIIRRMLSGFVVCALSPMCVCVCVCVQVEVEETPGRTVTIPCWVQ